MRTLILTNSDTYSIPSLYKVKEKNNLVCVGIPEKNKRVFLPVFSKFSENLNFITKQNQEEKLLSIIDEHDVEIVYVISWPYLISKKVIDRVKFGVINFHFGLLPSEKGPDPIFWAIRNGKKETGVSLHKMNEKFDEGPLLVQKKIEISPMDNHGSLSSRLAYEASLFIDNIEDYVVANNFLPKDEGLSRSLPKVTIDELTIDWEKMNSSEIIWLIQATNPTYGGALTIINRDEVRILEAELANINQPPIAPAGSIVHADQMYGIIVLCSDFKCIKISVVHMRDGYCSGTRLFYMGLKPGDKFQSIKKTNYTYSELV